MNVLKKKLGKTGGFTLIEMLIVVAIIAILVAISIPLINNALERARDATDQANERAAKAEAVLLYMGMAQDPTTGNSITYDKDKPYYYDAAEGALKDASGTFTAPKYGKCSGGSHATNNKPVFMYAVSTESSDPKDGTNKHTDAYLRLNAGGIDDKGVVTFVWVVPT